MPYISVSNVRVAEAVIEKDEGEFCIIKLFDSDTRFRVQKNRLYSDRIELEEKIGIKVSQKSCRTPADYFH